jgi:hypothetical protein
MTLIGHEVIDDQSFICGEVFPLRSQYVHPKHPPDQEYRDDATNDVNDPVASCFRLSKIEHAPMVAVPAPVT